MRTIGALGLALVIAGCSAGARAGERHVILVSVDGLASFSTADPAAPMPTLQRLAAEGATAAGLRCSFPTVTWPNHTTLVTGVSTGRHGVIGNNYFDRAKGEVVALIPDPLFDKEQIVKVPTVYDVAHRAGLRTAGVIWPATRNAPTLDLAMPDVLKQELFDRYTTPAWAAELKGIGLPLDRQEAWCKAAGGGVMRDWMYARAAAHALVTHRPHLLLLHLIELDHAQHAFGPRSAEATWALSHIDDRLRDLVEAIEAAGLAGRTTLVVVSDHGFFPYTRQAKPNALLKNAGIEPRQARVVGQGGGAFVYLLEPGLDSRVRELLAGLEGVAAVIGADQYAPLGLATPAEDPRMPDLIISAVKGYSFSDKADGAPVEPVEGVKGAHGFLPDDPEMLGTFVIWGAGVRAGVRLGVIDNVDVAPTIAHLLGLTMPGVEGKVRVELLSEPAAAAR
jgi:predicted AlkP superfamily pyrophosphatase or phosphodiesterase